MRQFVAALFGAAFVAVWFSLKLDCGAQSTARPKADIKPKSPKSSGSNKLLKAMQGIDAAISEDEDEDEEEILLSYGGRSDFAPSDNRKIVRGPNGRPIKWSNYIEMEGDKNLYEAESSLENPLEVVEKPPDQVAVSNPLRQLLDEALDRRQAGLTHKKPKRLRRKKLKAKFRSWTQRTIDAWCKNRHIYGTLRLDEKQSRPPGNATWFENSTETYHICQTWPGYYNEIRVWGCIARSEELNVEIDVAVNTYKVIEEPLGDSGLYLFKGVATCMSTKDSKRFFDWDVYKTIDTYFVGAVYRCKPYDWLLNPFRTNTTEWHRYDRIPFCYGYRNEKGKFESFKRGKGADMAMDYYYSPIIW